MILRFICFDRIVLLLYEYWLKIEIIALILRIMRAEINQMVNDSEDN